MKAWRRNNKSRRMVGSIIWLCGNWPPAGEGMRQNSVLANPKGIKPKYTLIVYEREYLGKPEESQSKAYNAYDDTHLCHILGLNQAGA